MATLPTNFKDDILDTSVNTRRRYRMYENTDGTIELEDVTEYSQVGDEFSAGQINATNTEVNKKFDKNMIVRDLDTISAITKEGYVPDALAIKEVNDSLGDISNIGNDNYNSVEKLLQYYIDNGYLPDINAIALIPIMTSNTTPSGVASASSEYSTSYQAWRAFNGNISSSEDRWASVANDSNCYLQYKFDSAVKANAIELMSFAGHVDYNFTLQASNDESGWVNLYSGVLPSTGKVRYNFTNANYYSYYRCKLSGNESAGGHTLTFMQLYGDK